MSIKPSSNFWKIFESNLPYMLSDVASRLGGQSPIGYKFAKRRSSKPTTESESTTVGGDVTLPPVFSKDFTPVQFTPAPNFIDASGGLRSFYREAPTRRKWFSF